MLEKTISRQSLQRLTQYYNYIKPLLIGEDENISATKIAEALNLNHVVVRKDLASISSSGKPKVGYNKSVLINEIGCFLGYNSVNDAIIIGAGKLGKALISFEGFKDYGFNILAAFDVDEEALKEGASNKLLLPINKCENFCKRSKVKIGIVTVPDDNAQAVANLLVKCEIKAIWNFSSVKLLVPNDVLVHNENMAASMALLSNHLAKNYSK